MPVVLSEPEWREREHAHLRRVTAWTRPHRERQRGGRKHPVLDFLFTYYNLRASRLERWQPGPGVVLRGGEEFLRLRGYETVPDGVALSPAAVTDTRRGTAEFVLTLQQAILNRPARLNCFGLHEWAMVYRATDIRHESWPLRLGSAGTDEVVEANPVRCSHYDAYRFFTPDARPLNTLAPDKDTRLRNEQPGCLHANMDLFKWAGKLEGLLAAELIADCFELAVAGRELDMRASPYDLAELGYRPIRIETPAGRAEYARHQAEYAQRAAPVRRRLADACAALLDWAEVGSNLS
ncbi:3-methyladenine DNA glycosylase [Pseudonocardiaceae bacterium YIM PH 21723]|nr:3-methyladenine DNA glycosylase [Pseudonocardiaceae bacterium YIM PH 21723]